MGKREKKTDWHDTISGALQLGDPLEDDLDLVIAWSDEEEFVIKEIESLKEAIRMHEAVTHHAKLHLSIMEKRLKEISKENENET